MRKTIHKKGMIIVIIFLFIGMSIPSAGNVITQINYNNCTLEKEDVLDQYQMEMDSFGPIGRTPDGQHYYIVAQGFTPTKNILTCVEIKIRRSTSATKDLILNIRDDLNGPNLTSIRKNYFSIPTEDFNWIEFNFKNITTTPGKTYYIVCSTFDTIGNWYEWGAKMGNVYPNGTIGWSEDGQQWYLDSTLDAAFKTYGRDNQAPDKPIIKGPTPVGPGTYNYTFNSTDPEGDEIFYCINRSDGIEEWIGPYESGKEMSINITWKKKGNFAVKIKAKDIYDAESEWGLLNVTVPKYKSPFLNFPILNRLFEMFPNMFMIMRYILGFS